MAWMRMKVMGINGSPRREWNTGTLVADALEGAASEGAETEIVNLYDMVYPGCRSCFGCKRIGIDDHRCYLNDELTPVLDRMREADVLVFGSPIYFFDITAGLAACMERFLFPYTTYSEDPKSFGTKRVPSAFIYTMNVGEVYMEKTKPIFSHFERFTNRHLGVEPEVYHCLDTWQYPDYDRYEHDLFDVEAKRARREEHFPLDRQACFEMGARLVRRARGLRYRSFDRNSRNQSLKKALVEMGWTFADVQVSHPISTGANRDIRIEDDTVILPMYMASLS